MSGWLLRAASLGVPAAGATALPAWEGINVCVRRGGEGAGVHGVRTGALMMWCVSHTP